MAESGREQAALARWRPGRRWYHPAVARFVIGLSKVVTTRMNRLEIEGLDRLEAARERRDRGLLTYSNHVSLFDDPLLDSNFDLGAYDGIRWIAADAINFFGSRARAWLFTAGRAVPIMRGFGVDQPGLAFLGDRLREGAWVHMFPEGGRTRGPNALMADSFKSGIGRLMAEARPALLPFYHYGMHEVLPVGAKLPRRGKTVRVVFGEAVDCDEAYVSEAGGSWEALAARAHSVLREMERRVHPLGGTG